MPDLNELLRWSIANSDPQPEFENGEQPLSLRFNPPSSNQPVGSSALHPSDPLYPSASHNAPSQPTAASAPPTTSVNSEILELIMGRPDSAVMKEKMTAAMDESLPVDERVEALDDLEMLVEQIDNANNMTALKLWDPLLSLLSSPHQTIVAHTCWIAGTAVQNNLKAQAALYVHDALPRILDIIYPASGQAESSRTARSRATYALSSALKHWPLAVPALAANSSRGYSVLKRGVSDPDATVRRKMAFLIGTLVMQSGEEYGGEIPKEVEEVVKQHLEGSSPEPKQNLLQGLEGYGVLSALVESLKGDFVDIEFEENAMRALAAAAEKGGLSQQEKTMVKAVWDLWGEEGQKGRGLGGEEGKTIGQALS